MRNLLQRSLWRSRACRRFVPVMLSCAGLLVCVPGAVLGQAASDESKAFAAALWAFDDGVFDRADRELTSFIATYPQSERLPEAKLFRARAALELNRPEVAIDLLSTNLDQAGFWTDRYHFWLAETRLRTADYEAAADGFAKVVREFPESQRLLDASYKEAWSRFQMRDTAGVIQLLQDPGGVFQKAVVEESDPRVVREGYFLLAESLLDHGRYGEAEKAARGVNTGEGDPEVQWRRQDLICRIQLAAGQLRAALDSSTNLVALAVGTGKPQLRAESVVFQAEVLLRLDRPIDAAKAYEQNLAVEIPEQRRRLAMLKIIDLTLAEGKPLDAIGKLDAFLETRPNDPAGDVVLLTLGELHLRLTASEVKGGGSNDVVSAAATSTNHLTQALARFNGLLTGFPNSPLVGKGQLGKGWCLWAANRISESQDAFAAAAELLPPSKDQAVALFKLADTQFRQGKHTNSIQNLQKLIRLYADVAEVREELFGNAYYQILRAAIGANDLETATAAMRKILADYPEGDFRGPSLLLMVQAAGAKGGTEAARGLFDQYSEGFPETPLLPDVQLALIRTYVQDRDWVSAIEGYDQWIARFPTNQLRGRVEFDRAWAYDQAGQPDQAYSLFTNLVANFPADEVTLRGRYWIGDYHYHRREFREAQEAYQGLAEAFPGTPLSYQARMMAGRAARFWTDSVGPLGQFTLLIADESCPPEIKAQAYFAWGDTMVEQGRVDTNQTFVSFEEALARFTKIPSLYPTNRLVAPAWGRIGDCHLQLAAKDPNQYGLATNAYESAISSPLADVAVRSQAEIGLGLALEKMAALKASPEKGVLMDAARDRFLNVFYGSNLKEGEESDPFWLKEAGLAAARLAESQEQWSVAVNYYKRLMVLLPPLKSALEKRLERAQSQVRQQAL